MTTHLAPGNVNNVTRSRSARVRAKRPDAISILKGDHAKVKKMFADFSRLDDHNEKQALARQICSELTMHTRIEEELFYPAARDAQVEADLLDEAEIEHASAKDLIAQIESGSPDDDKWNAKVTVLGEYINHHVAEEHKELFPKVRKSTVDLQDLGRALLVRKNQLTMNR
jgi:hemerythrin superfamily protein